MKYFLILLFVLVPLSGALAEEPLQKQLKGLHWNKAEDPKKYASLSWNKITTPFPQGFGSSGVVKKTECAGYDDKTKGPYLQRAGGKCNMGTWLEIKKGEHVERIDGLEKLKKAFAPVENESEAVSFVAATERVRESQEGIPERYSAKADDGYLVLAFFGPPFGCSTVQSQTVLFKISPAGEIEKIALGDEKKVGPEMCRD